MPEPRAMHTDAVLSNLSIQYRNGEMIWQQVMPIVKVGKRSDVYYVYNKEDSFKLVDDTLGPKGLANEIDWGVSSTNYSVRDHGLGDWLAQEAIDNADNPLQPEIDTNDFLNLCLDVAQEKRVADIIFDADSYPSGNKTQLSSTAQFGDSADNPIGVVQTAVEACLVRANTLVFGAYAWKVFRKLPEILDAVKSSSRFQGSPGGLATAPEVAGLFEVDKIIVGRSRYNTAAPGQTSSLTYLWGNHISALYVNPNPGIKTITFGVTFCESLRQTSRDFDPKRGLKGAHYIRPAWNSDEKTIATDCGYFIEDAAKTGL